MALAMMYPDGERGRGKNAEARKAQVSGGFSSERLRQARQVLAHRRSLAEDVIKGTKRLDDALAIVQRELVGSYAVAAKWLGSITESMPFSVSTHESRIIWASRFSLRSASVDFKSS
jgi:hypothetical protein